MIGKSCTVIIRRTCEIKWSRQKNVPQEMAKNPTTQAAMAPEGNSDFRRIPLMDMRVDRTAARVTALALKGSIFNFWTSIVKMGKYKRRRSLNTNQLRKLII
jgi:hypothetical protein